MNLLGGSSLKQDLTNYIAQELKDIHPFFQWKVQNNSIRKTVEVFTTFRIPLEGKQVAIQDIYGTNLTTDYLQFEDVIGFYDPLQSDVQRSNYLKLIECDNTQGIAKGEVDVVLKHLIRVLSSGKLDLQAFIESNQNEFELKWKQSDYERALDTAKSLNRYNTERLFMDFNEEISIINELTEGDKNDGVERI